MQQEEVLKRIESIIPNRKYFNSKEIGKLGFFGNKSTLARNRRMGKGPRFFELTDRKIIYFREDLIDWMLKHAGGGE